MIENIIEVYPQKHIFKELVKNKDKTFTRTFLEGMGESLERLKGVNQSAYKDFVRNKLKAKNGKDNFDKHGLVSGLCELSIINSFISASDDKESFSYEPQLRLDNKKNVEFTIRINNVKYNVEVKSPNFENYDEKLNKLLDKKSVVTYHETRMFELTEEEKNNNMTATDGKVKDFLVDSNLKFPIVTSEKEINVLFICWNDNNDQPCTALKHPVHGLLTKNSWHRNELGEVESFDNIDLIFVSDLYQNIIAHMLSYESPISGFISGVPYFTRNERFIYPINKLNPFFIAYSRNVLIKPIKNIKEEYIFPLPICFSDQYVDVIDEKYVTKYCHEFKFSYLTKN